MAKQTAAEKFEEAKAEVLDVKHNPEAGPAYYPNDVDDEDRSWEPQVEIVDNGLQNVMPEVHVVMDEVRPLVRQNDPAGRGDLNLPIHAFVGAKTAQQQFDEAAKGDDKPAAPADDKPKP
jgi:hypothetical protein